MSMSKSNMNEYLLCSAEHIFFLMNRGAKHIIIIYLIHYHLFNICMELYSFY